MILFNYLIIALITIFLHCRYQVYYDLEFVEHILNITINVCNSNFISLTISLNAIYILISKLLMFKKFALFFRCKKNNIWLFI